MSSNSTGSPDLDPQDKDAWIAEGSEDEKQFVTDVAPEIGLGARLNPEKEEDPCVIDLIVDGVYTDLKHVTTPFFTAEKNLNIDPQYAITFNKIDYRRYKDKLEEKGRVDVLFWVQWNEQSEYGTSLDAVDGVWRISMQKIIDLVESGTVSSHRYKHRHASSRNATESYGLDLREMTPVLRDGIRYFTQDELETAASVSPGEMYCFPEFVAEIDCVSLPAAAEVDRRLEYSMRDRSSVMDDIVIEYTKYQFEAGKRSLPVISDYEGTQAKVSASGWAHLSETLGLIELSLPSQ